jgi:putative oxidoreductase
MLSIGLLIVRVVVGLTVAAHGAQKLFGWFGGPGISGFGGWLASMGIKPARPWAVVAALAEFAGGLLVALGFLGPVGYLAACGSMLTAILLVHAGKGFFASNGGYEFPLTILAVLAGTSLIGPGALSLDRFLRVALPEPATWLVVALLVLIGVGASLASTKVQQAGQTKPQVV